MVESKKRPTVRPRPPPPSRQPPHLHSLAVSSTDRGSDVRDLWEPYKRLSHHSVSVCCVSSLGELESAGQTPSCRSPSGSLRTSKKHCASSGCRGDSREHVFVTEAASGSQYPAHGIIKRQAPHASQVERTSLAWCAAETLSSRKNSNTQEAAAGSPRGRRRTQEPLPGSEGVSCLKKPHLLPWSSAQR